jgi:hypothetical protein
MRILLGTLAAALIGATATLLLLRPEPVRAQEASQILHVTGMRIDKDKPIAIVRMRNASPDFMVVHYTVLGPDAGAPLSEPNAGDGILLIPGAELEVDLGKTVTLYRRSLGAGPYSGPVGFAATGDLFAGAAFTEGRIAVSATQTEGKAKFQANIEWR